MSAATRCPFGEQYAHSLFDLVPARPWDEYSTAKATQPCPLGITCPEYVQPVTVFSTTTIVPSLALSPRKPDRP
jgi:hypothetical protein